MTAALMSASGYSTPAVAATAAVARRCRGPPMMDAGAAGPKEVARAYDAAARSKLEQVQKYAERLLREPPLRCSRRIGELPEIFIPESARATLDEIDAGLSIVVPEQQAAATALNRRGSRACGLQPDESFCLRMHDGSIAALVLRNYIPHELAAAWPDVAEHHRRHATMWGLGCEAEPPTNIERTTAALKTASGSAGYRIQDGMRVHSFGPRNGEVTNKLTITYTNADGRLVENFGIGGCPIERHHHPAASLDKLCARSARAEALLACLRDGYKTHARRFMTQKGFPPEVSATQPVPAPTCQLTLMPLLDSP